MSSCLRMRSGSAIRHADRLANSVRSLSRHSPYASSLARVRLSASSHRPHAILYAHGSLLHAKSLSHTVFLLGQAEQFDSSCGATRLDALAPTLSYVRMPLSCLIIFSVHYIMHEVRCIPTYAELCLRRFKAPSPILCGALREDSARAAFQVALGSPFGKTLHTAISAPAVLCREGMSLLTHSSSTV